MEIVGNFSGVGPVFYAPLHKNDQNWDDNDDYFYDEEEESRSAFVSAAIIKLLASR